MNRMTDRDRRPESARWLAMVWLIALAAAMVTPGRSAVVAAAESPASEEAPAAPSLLQRVAVIGASASCGFGVEAETDGPFAATTVPADMRTVVEAMLPETAAVSGHCSIFFFTEPTAVGPKLMTDALATEPTMVFALDYLFWFGYGSKDAKRQQIDEEADRLALLEQGLKQLERCACPVVIGDFPNMEDAVGLMLSERQLPEPETLEKLNARIRDWATDRDNVVLVPIAELVDSMKAGREVRIGDEVWPPDAMEEVIQRDQLHPTVDGLVLMAQLALSELDAVRDDVVADHFVTQREAALRRISEVLKRK